MKFTGVRTYFALVVVASAYMILSSRAHADEWGCEVILCLSNPGGPTQFAACRPPIEKLWHELAKGRSFPTCRGVGFSASQPGDEPYYCNTGFRLTSRYGVENREAACVSLAPREVSSSRCALRDSGRERRMPARWVRDGDRLVCKATVTTAPNRRDKPRFIDITIEGQSRQRVWF
ncbi:MULTISPECIES: hypothetical protein [unclassified Aureimonas]|uniref:hypothetical protein n=1 Tax=unclassified Aureimonas TaxID=2615206 RepID=UPI0009E957D6|nr:MULTISPECIES: hypothetical protein [unclassified Aureimonas]